MRTAFTPVAALASLIFALGFAVSPSLAESPVDGRSDYDAREAVTVGEIPDSALEGTLVGPANDRVTPADLAACMSSWDPQTQMSKEEYKESCKRTLKYYPENP